MKTKRISSQLQISLSNINNKSWRINSFYFSNNRNKITDSLIISMMSSRLLYAICVSSNEFFVTNSPNPLHMIKNKCWWSFYSFHYCNEHRCKTHKGSGANDWSEKYLSSGVKEVLIINNKSFPNYSINFIFHTIVKRERIIIFLFICNHKRKRILKIQNK